MRVSLGAGDGTVTAREHAVASAAIANSVDRLVSRELSAAVRVMWPKPYGDAGANVRDWRPTREDTASDFHNGQYLSELRLPRLAVAAHMRLRRLIRPRAGLAAEPGGDATALEVEPRQRGRRAHTITPSKKHSPRLSAAFGPRERNISLFALRQRHDGAGLLERGAAAEYVLLVRPANPRREAAGQRYASECLRN